MPSEGKFGVSGGQAVELMQTASTLGLQPYGIAYHVGSQMTQPNAWEDATRRAAAVLRALQAHGITLRMLNIGGGFPARYTDPVPDLADYGACIRQAVARHLPYPIQLCAEPGRALVAEAGVLVTTIIGTAERAGRSWLHLDVGAFNGMMETLLTQNRLVYPLADSGATDERCCLPRHRTDLRQPGHDVLRRLALPRISFQATRSTSTPPVPTPPAMPPPSTASPLPRPTASPSNLEGPTSDGRESVWAATVAPWALTEDRAVRSLRRQPFEQGRP